MSPAQFRSAIRGGALAVALLAMAGCAAGAGTHPRSEAAPRPETVASEPGPSPARDDRTLGAPDARVTIIEFTDLQCPYCARFALQTWPSLRAAYVDTGKVRFASRDLPLPFHPYALPAAVAARCAGRQGKFWEYREALFRGQSQLGTAPYDALAARLGLDVASFSACRADPQVAGAVRADAAAAAAHGIVGTPTFVIGHFVEGQFQGELVSGAQPYEVFQQKIDSLLQQAQQ